MNISSAVSFALSYAALAPSGHNTQPWLVRIVSDRELLFWLDEERLIPATDRGGREAMISLGCFIEYFDIALSSCGFKAEYVVEGFPDSGNPVRVFLSSADDSRGDAASELELIGEIFTNRNPFLRDKIGFVVLDRLSFSVSDGSLHYFPAMDRKGLWLASALVDANKKQFSDDDKLIELANWLRFNKREIAERRDGLTAEMLGLGFFSRLFWYTFFNRKTVFSPLFRKTSVDTVILQVNNCAGFFVVSSRDDSPASIIGSGRDYVRFCIAAFKEGLGVHPMSQVLEELPFADVISDELGLAGPAQLILRVGFSSDKRSRGVRRAVEDFLLVDDK